MLKDGGRQSGNREERSLSASTVIARWQGNGEPCKSRGLRTVLWAAGGEIPPADPAAQNPYMQRHGCGFPEALEALAAQLGPPTAPGQLEPKRPETCRNQPERPRLTVKIRRDPGGTPCS